jgi:hypothetical protein
MTVNVNRLIHYVCPTRVHSSSSLIKAKRTRPGGQTICKISTLTPPLPCVTGSEFPALPHRGQVRELHAHFRFVGMQFTNTSSGIDTYSAILAEQTDLLTSFPT